MSVERDLVKHETPDDEWTELTEARESLSRVAESVRIVGVGPHRFLVADLGDYGVELYIGEDGFIVDPAIRQELQGEHAFSTIEDAVEYACEWLTSKR